MLKKLVCFFLLSYFQSSFACSPAVDSRTFAERLKDAPVSFLGTVTNIATDGKVTFTVDHWMSSNATDKTYTVQGGHSMCDIQFSVGDKWIFGGTTVFDPSMNIKE